MPKHTKTSQWNIPPVMTKCQLCRHADLCQLMVVKALQLVLAVVDAVERRREHDQEREDNAENEVVAGLWQFVNLLHDCPADVKYRQIHFVHSTRLPHHATHYTQTNDFLFLAARLLAYWPAPWHRQPILSSCDFWQASSVLQPKAFYF